MMLVIMKLDINGFRRITFQGCRLHRSCFVWHSRHEVANIDIFILRKNLCKTLLTREFLVTKSRHHVPIAT